MRAALVLVVVGAALYAGALSAPFHFDDLPYIVQDEAIRTLWPVGGHDNRPTLTFSLALNYALSGLDPRAFRAVNIAIHVAAALLLHGLVRRTIRTSPVLQKHAGAADGIAFAVALLWVTHPVQTQAVTYVWQRGESLMGLFFLATLYAIARLAAGGARGRWSAAAVTAFLLGLGTKEVMVAVLPTALVYDGILLAPSIRAAIRLRWRVYAAMAAVVAFGAIVLLPRTHTSFGAMSSWRYALSQPAVLLEYLRLAVWPDPLCFDYRRPPAYGFLAIGPPAAAVGLLVAGTLLALWRRSWLGVAGAWFFLILAPTSSFIRINDLMVEYRLYLPLAAVIVLLVAGGRAACRRLGIPPAIPLVVAALALGITTIRRNHDYRSTISLWESVLEVVPDNARAHDLLAVALSANDRVAEAAVHARRAVELEPASDPAHWNLGTILRQLGDPDGALREWQESLRINPRSARSHREVASLLMTLEHVEEAAAHYRQSIALEPHDAAGLYALGMIHVRRGERSEALRYLEDALRRDPRLATDLRERAWRGVARSGRPEERALAIELGELAERLGGD